ncbi:hypothetical protein TorRG33x02_059670 [Trema orientale]|uniref:Transmembrane protein n=1 Tax=Trema orientale TaxID=63057 RepID=A0A2P5FK32_TREOI|nr:hypothetical protein TorRG33x02_059670 [Trema orientale]
MKILLLSGFDCASLTKWLSAPSSTWIVLDIIFYFVYIFSIGLALPISSTTISPASSISSVPIEVIEIHGRGYSRSSLRSNQTGKEKNENLKREEEKKEKKKGGCFLKKIEISKVNQPDRGLKKACESMVTREWPSMMLIPILYS